MVLIQTEPRRLLKPESGSPFDALCDYRRCLPRRLQLQRIKAVFDDELPIQSPRFISVNTQLFYSTAAGSDVFSSTNHLDQEHFGREEIRVCDSRLEDRAFAVVGDTFMARASIRQPPCARIELNAADEKLGLMKTGLKLLSSEVARSHRNKLCLHNIVEDNVLGA